MQSSLGSYYPLKNNDTVVHIRHESLEAQTRVSAIPERKTGFGRADTLVCLVVCQMYLKRHRQECLCYRSQYCAVAQTLLSAPQDAKHLFDGLLVKDNSVDTCNHVWQRSVGSLYAVFLALFFVLFFCSTAVFSQYNILEKRHHEARLPSERNALEDSLLPKLPQATDTTKVAMLNALAWSYRGINFLLAMQYAQEGAQLVANLGYPRVRAENCNFIGIIYRNVGDYEKAMMFFQQAKEIAEKQGYRAELGYALNNIGDVYKYRGDYDLAKKYVEQSLKMFTELNNISGLYYGYFRLGEIAQLEKDFLSAVRLFKQSRQYNISSDNRSWKAANLLATGQAYLAASDYSSALQAFFDADVSITDSSLYNEDIVTMSYIQKGKAYKGLQNLDSAVSCLEEGLRRAQVLQAQVHIREAARELAFVYTTVKDYRQVAYFQALQIEAADSLVRQSERQEIERLGAKYELAKQQSDIDALRSTQERQQIVGIMLVLGIVLLISIALLLFRNIRTERRANSEITRQQKILEHQALEIEMNNTVLVERNSLLSNLTQEKTELMEIVSHDLKNPIGAVRGLAELIQYELVQGPKVSHTAEQIVLTSNKMFHLVTNVLDLNRLEEGGMRFSMIELDIANLVESCVEQHQQQASLKNIAIHFENTAESALILADEQACFQIMDNLLSNAVKYSPHGKQVFVRIQAVQTAEEHPVKAIGHASQENGNLTMPNVANAHQRNLRIEVQDEGEGISADDMTKLFGKFSRLSSKPTGGEHSTGLGLSIVKKMVEEMKGKVWCESEVQHGATFIVSFPLVHVGK